MVSTAQSFVPSSEAKRHERDFSTSRAALYPLGRMMLTMEPAECFSVRPVCCTADAVCQL